MTDEEVNEVAKAGGKVLVDDGLDEGLFAPLAWHPGNGHWFGRWDDEDLGRDYVAAEDMKPDTERKEPGE